MTSKFELTISTGYVPDWGIVEAMREIFQNALDNEISNPENKMGWKFENGVISVSNKTSKLAVESLLLGCSTKANDSNTIGKWGEGYKIAFMVLLRNGKKVKVYNYGAREVWEVRLVKSKRFNGQLITTVFVDKEPVWKKVPDNDLVIEVSGITEDEYNQIKEKNLNLRPNTLDVFSVENQGSIILNEEEQGNIYVKGLFITSEPNLKYGYDFEPSVISLDRDRRMVSSFNVQWQSSMLWIKAASNRDDLKDIAVKLINENVSDITYVSNISSYSSELSLVDAVAQNFYKSYGNNAVPVVDNSEYKYAEEIGDVVPIIVSEKIAEIIKRSTLSESHSTLEFRSLKDKFRVFMEKIESKLTDEELEEFEKLIEQID